MAGAGFFTGASHAEAWDWLQHDVVFDFAMLQEAIPPSNLDESFDSVLFRPRFPSQHLLWGNCTLARHHKYGFSKVQHAMWASSSMDAALIASGGDELPVLINVHSNAKPIEDFPRAEFAAAGGLMCHKTKVWEIEVLAQQLKSLLSGRRFVLGGDINAGLLLDEVYGYKTNEILWKNLATLGYVDLRQRHSQIEQQTFFREKTKPYQLDHFFGDVFTAESVKTWTVLTEVARDLKLSDHAPVLVEIG